MIKKWLLALMLAPGLAACSMSSAPPQVIEHKPSKALEQCWDKVVARAALAQCLEKKLNVYEALLKESELAVSQEMLQLDEITRTDIAAVASFNRQKLAFRQYRQDFCSWKMAEAASGNSSGDQFLACKVELTKAQLRLLDIEL